MSNVRWYIGKGASLPPVFSVLYKPLQNDGGALIMENMNSLNDLHIDVLKEIGNIGSGNAIATLSKLLDQPVKMTVPKVKLLDFTETAEILGSPEELVFGILVNISGDINGMMMFLLKLNSARILINGLLNKQIGDDLEFSEMDQSALQEIGNILCSSYLGALSGLISKTVTPSVPMLAKDMAGAILSVPAIEFSKISDKVLFIDSIFEAGGKEVSGYFLLVPDMPSFNTIMKSLGVM